MLGSSWGGSANSSDPETDIKSLCHRFHHAAAHQDQQDMVEDLTVSSLKIRTPLPLQNASMPQVHAKEHPDIVGRNAIPVFVTVLAEDEQHEDLTQSILELLLEVLGGRPNVGGAADE